MSGPKAESNGARRAGRRVSTATPSIVSARRSPWLLPAEFMRFLFAWQHVEPGSQPGGRLRAVFAQLDGVELPRAWERDVLPARVDRYELAMLDMLCLTGDVAWARPSSGLTQVVGATPIALHAGRPAPQGW